MAAAEITSNREKSLASQTPTPLEPPKEEYKPETDPYQPEYERKDPYKSTAGHVTVEFFRQINAEASGTPSVNGVMVPRRPKNYVKSKPKKEKNSVKSPLEPRQRNGVMVPLPETSERQSNK